MAISSVPIRIEVKNLAKSKTQYVRVTEKNLSKAIKALDKLRNNGLINAAEGGISGTKCTITGTKDNGDFSCTDSD